MAPDCPRARGAVGTARYGAEPGAEALFLTGCDMSMPPALLDPLPQRRPVALAGARGGAGRGRAYGAEPVAEVLLRAFLAERDLEAEGVRFWLSVYDSLAPPGRRSAGRP